MRIENTNNGLLALLDNHSSMGFTWSKSETLPQNSRENGKVFSTQSFLNVNEC